MVLKLSEKLVSWLIKQASTSKAFVCPHHQHNYICKGQEFAVLLQMCLSYLFCCFEIVLFSSRASLDC